MPNRRKKSFQDHRKRLIERGVITKLDKLEKIKFKRS